MSGVTTAVFLAAGRGLRLGPRGEETPKGLIDVGGRSLMDQALDKLEDFGLSDIVIVTGHLAHQYEAFVQRRGPSVRTVYNPKFATLGSGHSLLVGLGEVEPPFLLLEADLLWERAALDGVLSSGADSTLLISGPTCSGDEVWVWGETAGDGDGLQAMSKNKALREVPPRGELVGLTRLGARACALLHDIIPRLEAHDPMVDYESCLVATSLRAPIRLRKIEDLAWGEIDDEIMLAHARDVLFAEIQKRDSTRLR